MKIIYFLIIVTVSSFAQAILPTGHYTCSSTNSAGIQSDSQITLTEVTLNPNVKTVYFSYSFKNNASNELKTDFKKEGFPTLTVLESGKLLLKLDTVMLEFDKDGKLIKENCTFVGGN